jgi:hypothetical protein
MRVAELDAFYLVIVTAKPRGEFTRSGEMRFASLESALTMARRLQAEFDEDCEPKRAYVMDSRGIAHYAGGAPVTGRTS